MHIRTHSTPISVKATPVSAAISECRTAMVQALTIARPVACLTYPHYESGYWSGGYCHECTQDSHCGSGQVYTDYQCVAGPTCHASCKTCSGTGSDYCESCDSTGAYPYHRSGLISGGWCEECIQTSNCPSSFKCEGHTCVNAACSDSMPSKSSRTVSGLKHVVKLKSVTVKVHEGETG